MVLVMLALSGCSFVGGVVQQKVGDLITRDLILLDASSYGQAVAISQKVDVNIASNTFSLIQQTEVDSDEVRLVGVTHFGAPFFTLKYRDGGITSTKMEQLPEAFRPELVLRDFQFAFWDADVLQQTYQEAGYHLVESELKRVLQKSGDKIMTVLYQNANPLKGRVQLLHHEFGYQVMFETFDVQRLETK